MSRIKSDVANLRNSPGVLAAHAKKKRPAGDASGRDTLVASTARPNLFRRLFGHRFAGDVPATLPPTAPAPAPQGIPSVGNDVPDAISYPRASGDVAANWCCCCCPGDAAPEVDPALRHRRANANRT